MNEPNLNPEDARLSALLRQSRAAPSLPPRFQEGVWRRIEDGEVPVRSAGAAGRLDTLAAWVLRPRLAFATIAMVILAGTLLGAREGAQAARQDAQARYLAAVAPNPLR
jgi:hypothetical protein